MNKYIVTITNIYSHAPVYQTTVLANSQKSAILQVCLTCPSKFLDTYNFTFSATLEKEFFQPCSNNDIITSSNQMEDSGMDNLYEFMIWGDYDQRIEYLANMTDEKWSFEGESNNSILKRYLNHTAKKLDSEGKIIITEKYCLFNTGLFTPYYEPIYVYAEKTLEKGNSVMRPDWYFKSFATPYDLGNIGISNLPKRADYFQDPSLLIFDVNCKINVQYRHILEDEDNKNRIPQELQTSKNLHSILTGAIDTMKKKVTANYKIAVPQYFNGNIQLLLPLCLVDEDVPDLALVVTKKNNIYQGHTCLDMKSAYNNARLIAKPESNWLVP